MTTAPQPPANIVGAVSSIAQQYGIPDGIWEDVAYTESGYNTSIVSGDGAYGLFQLQVAGGGQGATALSQGYTQQQLLDPAINAKIAMPSIAAAYNKLKGSFDANSSSWWLQFASLSGHPAENGNTSDPAVINEAAKLQANYNSSTDNNPGGVLAGVAVGALGASTGGAVASAIPSLSDFLNNVNWLQQHWQSGLIKIGIFIVALLLCGVGIFVVIRNNQ